MNNSENTNIDEFKAFGMTIEKISIIYGIFLIIWGIVISFLSNSNSFTSYIPSVLGIPILIFSLLSIIFINKKKNVHAYCCSLWIGNFFRWLRFSKDIYQWQYL